MKKLTYNKKEAIRLHRELWNWLAENPTKKNSDWPGWKEHKDAEFSCFLCHYDREKTTDTTSCNFCPLDWGNSAGCYGVKLNGYFIIWTNLNEDDPKRVELALKIANLKERKLL